MNESEKGNLREALVALRGGQFVGIKGYRNSHNELADIVVHADANYQSTHERSIAMLDAMLTDSGLYLDIVRNTYRDAAGNEYNRKAKDRVLVTGIRETVTSSDADFAAAVEKVRKGIEDPKTITDNWEKIASSTYDNTNTGKTYIRNVLVHSKIVRVPGEYPVSCSERVNVIADAIRDRLPIGKYRCYTLGNDNYEHVAACGNVSSSSSSGE